MPSNSSITVGGKEINPARGGLLFLVIGLAVTGYGGFAYVQQQQAIDAAESVNATILETGVEADSSGSGSNVEYYAEVQFTYSYQGERYTSNTVYPAAVRQSYDTESAARAVIDAYEINSSVTAYTTPDSPGDAFLRKEQSNGPYLAIGIGLVLMLLGAQSFLKGY